MKIQLTLSLILSVCFTCNLAGCAKIRQMTRRDFAVLNDPFLNDPAADDTVGVVRFGQASPAQPPGQPAVTQPPVQTVSNSQTVVPESALNDLAKMAAGDNPAATMAQKTNATGMPEMSAFMKQQAEASGLTETAKDIESDFEAFAAARQKEWTEQNQAIQQQVRGRVQQVANQVTEFGEAVAPSLPDMSFDEGFGFAETAEPLIHQAANVANQVQQSVTEAVAEMPNPFADQMPSDLSEFADNPFGFEAPIANQVQAAADKAEDAFSDFANFANSHFPQQTPAPTDQSNSFQSLTPPVAPQVQRPQQAVPSGQNQTNATSDPWAEPSSSFPQQRLDDKFGFDAGWRPANMERP